MTHIEVRVEIDKVLSEIPVTEIIKFYGASYLLSWIDTKNIVSECGASELLAYIESSEIVEHLISRGYEVDERTSFK